MRTEPESPVVRLDTVRHALWVVGRIRKGEQQLVFLRTRTRPPIPGPWELRAILAD
jgi:hypothetical protein